MERSTLDAAIDSYESRFYSQKKGTIHSTLSQTVLHLKSKVDRMNGKGARTKRRTARSQEKRPGQIETPIRSITKRPVYYWVSLIFLIHAFGLILLFAPPTGLFNSQAVIEQDWGLHFHHLKSMEAFWHQDRAFWGYNPFFMAGYPSNTIQDLSIKLFEFLALILSHVALTLIQWFKILTFSAMAAVPWLMYFAARNLFFDRDDIKSGAALVATLLGTAYWWNSLPREMFFYGMVGYAPASYASVLGVTFLYRIAKTQSLWIAQPAPCSLARLLFFSFWLTLAA